MRVPAKAREQAGAGFERVQQMERIDGPAGAVRLLAIARDDQRRAPSSLHHSRRADADHAAMPALAVDDHAVALAQRGVAIQALVDLRHDALLFRLALGVEPVEMLGQLAGARFVARREQLDHVAGPRPCVRRH